jgi:hypothetical protein
MYYGTPSPESVHSSNRPMACRGAGYSAARNSRPWTATTIKLIISRLAAFGCSGLGWLGGDRGSGVYLDVATLRPRSTYTVMRAFQRSEKECHADR